MLRFTPAQCLELCIEILMADGINSMSPSASASDLTTTTSGDSANLPVTPTTSHMSLHLCRQTHIVDFAAYESSEDDEIEENRLDVSMHTLAVEIARSVLVNSHAKHTPRRTLSYSSRSMSTSRKGVSFEASMTQRASLRASREMDPGGPFASPMITADTDILVVDDDCTPVNKYKEICALYNLAAHRSFVSYVSCLDFLQITSLNLSQSFAGRRGVMPFIEFVPLCPNLKHISLAASDIRDDAAIALCNVVANFLESLHTIDLRFNPFLGYRGGFALQKLAANHRAITTLKLDGTQVRGSTIRSIEVHLSRNKNNQMLLAISSFRSRGSSALTDKSSPENEAIAPYFRESMDVLAV